MKTASTLTTERGRVTHWRWRSRRSRVVLGGSLLIASAALAPTWVAGSVGASLKHQSATKLLHAAYDQTIDAKTAKVSISETVVRSNSLPLQITITGQGSVDFTSDNGELVLSSPQAGDFDVRVISPYVYIQLPATDDAQLPHGKTWISFNANTISQAKLGQSLSQLNGSSQQSTQLLSYLQSVSATGVTTIGPATIKGVATTEYKTTVDLTKVADQKNPTEQTTIKNLEAELNATMLPVQVWLDGQGRVRQISEQIQVTTNPQSNAGTTVPAVSGSVATTVDYYDFGSSATVQTPPLSQVDDITHEALSGSSTTSTSSSGT
jgi:hypothetical protein